MYVLTWYQWQSFPYGQTMKAFNLREFFIPLLEPWQVFRSRCHWAGSWTQWVIGQTDRRSAGEVVSGGKGLWGKKVGGVKGGEKDVNVKITVKYNKSWNFYGDKISLICGLKWFHRDLIPM